MVADVPVGAFLSGGLDSSAVVALMRNEAPDQAIHAFSIGFPGQAQYDEEPYARQVAELKQVDFPLRHYRRAVSRRLRGHGVAPRRAFRRQLGLRDLVSREARGEPDEGRADRRRRRRALRRLPGVPERCVPSRAGFAGRQSRLCYALVSAGARTGIFRGRLFDRLLTGLARRAGSEGLRYSEQVAQNSLHSLRMALSRDVFLPALSAWGRNLLAVYYDSAPSPDRLGRKLYAEYKTRLVDEMLMKVDRMTMAHSLEARVPLLDHHVVESAFRLSSAMKLRTGSGGSAESKYALKKVMEPYLPADIIYRRKHGFDMPVQDWSQGQFLEAMRERLLSGHLRKAGIVHEAGVQKLLDRVRDTHHSYTGTVMVLLALETWADVYSRRVGAISWR